MRFTDPVFRAHNPLWSWDPLSGEGARRHGGRFNRPGLAALYTATSPIGALLEASPGGRPLQPVTLCQYAVDCADLFDATDPDARAAMGVELDAISCPDWRAVMLAGGVPASQELADLLIAEKYVGMCAPSFARGAGPEHRNVIFWRWSDALPHRVQVIDDEGRLPSPPSSGNGSA